MTLRTWRLSPSSARTKIASSGSQNASLNVARSVLACARSAAATSGDPERLVDLGDPLLGQVDIALHLDERDRAFGQRAVGMHDGVVGVLPAVVA